MLDIGFIVSSEVRTLLNRSPDSTPSPPPEKYRFPPPAAVEADPGEEWTPGMREEYCLRSLSGPNSRTSVEAREGARKEEDAEGSCSSDLRSMLVRCRTVGEEGRAVGGEAAAAVFRDASDPLRSAYREMRRC